MRRLLVQTRTRFQTSCELLRSFWAGPFWWLVPVVLVLLTLAAMFIFLQAAPVVAPFVYAVF